MEVILINLVLEIFDDGLGIIVGFFFVYVVVVLFI